MTNLIDSLLPKGLRAGDTMTSAELCEPITRRAKHPELGPDYALVAEFITPQEWPEIKAKVEIINALKKEKNAVILAHNYMTPDIFRLVGDFRGDSLQLAHEAARVDADIIVQGGVHFMAETSKILAPHKKVLIPDLEAGCSLAASITGKDVRLIREKYPNVPIVTYVNTTADVKAACDITCTSSNALQVTEHVAKQWGSDTVILLPDQYLAQNVAAMTDIKILTWPGACEVHETFTGKDVTEIRQAYPGIVVLAHPECPPDVLEEADFAGSTSSLSDYVRDENPQRVVLLTECSMSDNVATDNPNVEFIRPCNLCPHMKRITLDNIIECLVKEQHEILVSEADIIDARKAIDAMLALPKPDKPASFKTGLKPKVLEFA